MSQVDQLLGIVASANETQFSISNKNDNAVVSVALKMNQTGIGADPMQL
jgi:hypothetical protein